MTKLIDKTIVTQRLCAKCSNMGTFACMSCTIPGIVRGIPEIEAEPVRHGHWMFLEQKRDYLWKCSNCKGNFDQRFSYCPNCGAKMDGGDDNG